MNGQPSTTPLVSPFERLVETASQARGTHPDAPRVRKLFDALAWQVPDDDFGFAIYKWAEEVTRLLQVSGVTGE